MLRLVFDIETDDLNATKVWCIVAQDADSGQIYKFAPHQLESGLELLQSAETLIGHNIIGFDIPVIHKLLGVDLSDKKLIDTLVLSRLFNPVREGGHSLEMWGYRLKYSKQDFNDYTNYSKEMMNYCVRDVQLNTLVFEKLKEESKGFSSESIYIEQEVSKILKKQEEDGFLFDRYNAEILLAKLREKMRDAEDQVHKVFKPKLSINYYEEYKWALLTKKHLRRYQASWTLGCVGKFKPIDYPKFLALLIYLRNSNVLKINILGMQKHV